MAEPRYRFSVDHENEDGRTTFSNTLEFDAEMLPDVIGNFELFLKGAGFAFDGHVDITPSEYTYNNSFNNLPDVKADSDYFAEANAVLRDSAEMHVKRPADTEGGAIE